MGIQQPTQPFHQLQPHRNAQALNFIAVCICCKYPLTKCAYRRSAQAHAVPHPHRFQETWVARGYHTCLLLTAVVCACIYSPGKPYYCFLPISKVWLKIQALKKKKKIWSWSVKAKVNLQKGRTKSTWQQKSNRSYLFCHNKP